MHAIRNRVGRVSGRLAASTSRLGRSIRGRWFGETASTSVNESYVLDPPSDQNVLDLFDGEWSSRVPTPDALARPGTADLFDDPRVRWAEEVLGGFEGRRILELGPLEAGHSYMFEQGGAAHVDAIEANSRAFMKCLCVKEVLGLERVRFHLGDFVSFLRDLDQPYDVVAASGVLYHMDDPVELVQLMSSAADRLFLWTHYYDADRFTDEILADRRFTPLRVAEHDGFSYQYTTQSYGRALGWAGFCGGPGATSRWLTRDSLFGALEHYGFTDIAVNFDEPDHQNGPAVAICAQR